MEMEQKQKTDPSQIKEEKEQNETALNRQHFRTRDK